MSSGFCLLREDRVTSAFDRAQNLRFSDFYLVFSFERNLCVT